MVVNDKKVMGKEHLNGPVSNILMIIVTWVTLILGIVNVVKAASTAIGFTFGADDLFLTAGVLALIITVLITIHIYRKRKRSLLE